MQDLLVYLYPGVTDYARGRGRFQYLPAQHRRYQPWNCPRRRSCVCDLHRSGSQCGSCRGTGTSVFRLEQSQLHDTRIIQRAPEIDINESLLVLAGALDRYHDEHYRASVRGLLKLRRPPVEQQPVGLALACATRSQRVEHAGSGSQTSLDCCAPVVAPGRRSQSAIWRRITESRLGNAVPVG